MKMLLVHKKISDDLDFSCTGIVDLILIYTFISNENILPRPYIQLKLFFSRMCTYAREPTIFK